MSKKRRELFKIKIWQSFYFEEYLQIVLVMEQRYLVVIFQREEKKHTERMTEMYQSIFGVCHPRVVKTYQPFLDDPKYQTRFKTFFRLFNSLLSKPCS